MTKNGFIDIDELQSRVTIDQVLDHFNVPQDIRHKTASELRTRCFLQCGKQCETGDRAIAIRHDTAAKLWMCHQYDCKLSGNLIALVSLARGGPARPKGRDFIEARDLLASIADGVPPQTDANPRSPTAQPTTANEKPVKVNMPLEDSEKEAVRAVANLHEKLTVDLSRVPPEVSRYMRRLGFLTEDVARDWGLGYLPKDCGGSKAGGTMRGKLLATIRNAAGKVVSYMGRDCQWEQKHQAWIDAGREGKEPAKWLFPRLFTRGIEAFGQDRLSEETVTDRLAGFGLPVVEGPLDTINLDCLELPSVAILSNQATDQQIRRIAELAHEFTGGVVTLLYDLDDEGGKGMDQDTVKFSKHCKVQRGWWNNMDDRLKVNDPAELNAEQVDILREHIVSRATQSDHNG